jgi:Protein of unknown function (DUF3592)
VSRRFGVVGYLAFAGIFLWFVQPDLLSGYAWAAIFATAAVVLLLGLVRPALGMRALQKGGAPAQGTVADAVRQTSDGDTYYHPRVQFTTADGRRVVFTSALGSQVKPAVGHRIPVRYRPDRPEHAEVEGATTWILPAAVGSLIGLGLVVAGIVAVIAE